MFTLLDAEKSRILSFIGKQLSNSKNELEARMFPPIQGQTECIDYYQFNRILQIYTFSKEKGGFGLAKDFVTGGQNNVGIRVPAHSVALELLKGFESLGGYGIAAPSANRF